LCGALSQLEAAGLWEWAAYVFLHTNLEQGHRAALELVARHIPLLQDETHNKRFRFLTEKLHVPVSLLHEALVLHTMFFFFFLWRSNSLSDALLCTFRPGALDMRETKWHRRAISNKQESGGSFTIWYPHISFS